ncbi:glutamate racemase [Pseudomonas typographi]|uniref:Glutamate racemase n=1 Tax=Pseudomonas typographi TaxID=2715964 RepID=A0ABR7YYZ4_9PSED|nr:glutamate racemase [Pseudomonas typographi]MBD1550894.1 glutamate racemase [Pseudomonas typographi]MBD1589120.1 glutamate racemase [Pseudomonas typographi]MBD1598359.1 glutamate racemase [Pseudomonas typographi]
MAANAAVAVFDSGIGGLSVLRELQALLPNESFLYVADGGHCPYGDKTPAFIRERLARVAQFFRGQGAKALVLACNTATVAAAADLRERYPGWPLVAMEPAVKPAASATRNGVVGVLATTGTLQSARFAALLDRFATDVKVLTQPCPGLVELIETGDLHSPALCALLDCYLQPLLAAGCDTLILGCTHYPFLRPLLAQRVPPEVVLIDTGAAVARQAQRLLGQFGLLSDTASAPVRYWTSGDREQFAQVLGRLGFAPGEVASLPV